MCPWCKDSKTLPKYYVCPVCGNKGPTDDGDDDDKDDGKKDDVGNEGSSEATRRAK